jgi:hypothetical protein
MLQSSGSERLRAVSAVPLARTTLLEVDTTHTLASSHISGELWNFASSSCALLYSMTF